MWIILYTVYQIRLKKEQEEKEHKKKEKAEAHLYTIIKVFVWFWHQLVLRIYYVYFTIINIFVFLFLCSYCTSKVARDENLTEQIGKDIYFDLVDHDKVRSFRIQKQMPFKAFKVIPWVLLFSYTSRGLQD